MALTYMLDIILTQWRMLMKQQLTPMLNSIEILVRIQSDVSFCVFYHLKLPSTTVVSLPTADWQQEVHFGYTCACCESEGTLRSGVSHPQAFRKLQECSCQCCYLGHPGLSESRDEALLAWDSAGHQSHCRMLLSHQWALCSWASRGQRAGEPQSHGWMLGTLPWHVFILLGCS